jgi:hypothetical protein
MTHGQPFSPGVAATHRANAHIFQVGDLAPSGIEAIAEDGNEAPAVGMLDGAAGITDVFDINRPITPDGVTIGDFTDSFTFEITARPGDRLSIALMLICTNDGIAAVDRARLPAHGSVSFGLNGYDAGTEDNTEMSDDIVDPCSALGPVALPGDPDGNDDAGVDSDPHTPIAHHAGVLGTGELNEMAHGWDDPVAMVTVERVD